MLEAIGNDSEGESLRLGPGVFRGGTVCQDPGQLGDLSDPAAVLLLFDLNAERQHAWDSTTGDGSGAIFRGGISRLGAEWTIGGVQVVSITMQESGKTA